MHQRGRTSLSRCGEVPDSEAPPRQGGDPEWGQGRALLTTKEVAKACGVSPKTVTRWLAYEGLPVVRLRGAGARAMLFVRPKDLENWLLQHRHDPGAAVKDERMVRIYGRRFVRRREDKDESRPREKR